ncbi:MAG: CBS domain-containing protein [Ardenticatenaceae bacterium]|nr:CBS domain-containing protein [Ardenticatenaceae bacterium]MCB8991173.1 CBS domain-containing protein [Ardenticatenaceae bacterium]
MKVSGILATKTGGVITAHPDQQIREAATMMAKHNIGSIVVVNQAGELVGILSERDIVRKAVTHDHVFDMPISDVMTQNVVTALPQDDLMSVAHTMTERRFRHMPILNADRELMGMISIGDVLKAQRDKYRGEIDTLETQLMADDA